MTPIKQTSNTKANNNGMEPDFLKFKAPHQ